MTPFRCRLTGVASEQIISMERKSRLSSENNHTENRIETKFVNGVRVLEVGSGPDVLFLHSTGMPPEGMDVHLKLLAPYAHVLAPNLFDLVKKPQELNFDTVAKELNNIVSSLDAQPRLVVGCSLGAGVAIAYAANYPEMVEKVIGFDSVGWPLNRSALQWTKEYMLMQREASKVPKDASLRSIRQQRYMIKEMRENPQGVWKATRLAAGADLRKHFPKVSVPVQLVWGEDDNFIPKEAGLEMQKLLPNATFQIGSSSMHYWYALEPEKMTEFILSALKIPKDDKSEG